VLGGQSVGGGTEQCVELIWTRCCLGHLGPLLAQPTIIEIGGATQGHEPNSRSIELVVEPASRQHRHSVSALGET